MTFKKIIFFNQFHNGDCFLGKSYVRDIMQLLPDVEFGYAHGNHPDILKDLKLEYLRLDQIPEIDRMTRVATSKDGEICYINTWVGCWQGTVFPYGEHINYKRLHVIWTEYYKFLGLADKMYADVNFYLPDIDYLEFAGIDLARDWYHEHDNQRKVLFCNGSANSGQSRAGDLNTCIDLLAKTNPDVAFVLTNKTNLNRPNIYYTDDIFDGIESDLNQIAYLAYGFNLIVGKNSGPFSYCQNKHNLSNDKLTFLNLSILPTDCPSGGGMYRARCVFSAETDDVKIADLCDRLLREPYYRGTEIIA